jgi:hypothetical protein
MTLPIFNINQKSNIQTFLRRKASQKKVISSPFIIMIDWWQKQLNFEHNQLETITVFLIFLAWTFVFGLMQQYTAIHTTQRQRMVAIAPCVHSPDPNINPFTPTCESFYNNYILLFAILNKVEVFNTV